MTCATACAASALAACTASALAACTEPAPPLPDDPLDQGALYVSSRAFRRAQLEHSIIDPDNGYSRLRLARYARDLPAGSWEYLPVWNPPARPVLRDDLGLAPGDRALPLAPLDTGIAWTHEEVLALGERAFEEFPVSIDRHAARVLASIEDARAAGAWIDERDRAGGWVIVRQPDGSHAIASTCATCHARAGAESGPLVHGAANTWLDLGPAFHAAALEDGGPGGGYAGSDYLDWGPGHVDPTADDRHNPTGITDLRPIRHQSHLNVAATLRNSLIFLTIRIETLLITARQERVRPPREVAFAIAYYLWSLGEPGPRPPLPPGSAEARGREVFLAACARCHFEDGGVAAPVAIEVVGTDPAAGRSPLRGTGFYRVPSLFGVADRDRLLHRGQVRSLERHLDPVRLTDTPGHLFGLDLAADDRADLIAFLRTL